MREDQAFEVMSERVARLAMPIAFRERIQRWLKYFYRQALADTDRRDRDDQIRQNFQAFELEIGGYNVLPELRKMEAWKVAQNFAGALGKLPCAGPIEQDPFFDRPAEIPLCPAHEFWTVEKLLTHARGKLALISEEDARSTLGLMDTLLGEAKKASIGRDKALIRTSWRTVLPVVVKYKVMDEFSGSVLLRQRLRFFLTGRI